MTHCWAIDNRLLVNQYNTSPAFPHPTHTCLPVPQPLKGRKVMVVADEDVPVPRPQAGLDIRTDGLWASLYCETPFEHWSMGLEAFGLIGLLLGPVIMSLAVALLRIYEQEATIRRAGEVTAAPEPVAILEPAPRSRPALRERRPTRTSSEAGAGG